MDSPKVEASESSPLTAPGRRKERTEKESEGGHADAIGGSNSPESPQLPRKPLGFYSKKLADEK